VRRAELADLGGDAAAAEALAGRALLLDPASAPALWHLGRLRDRRGAAAPAEAALRRALAVEPGFAAARQDLGMLLLRQGRAAGWAEYEARLRCPSFVAHHADCPMPPWDGGDPADRTLLLIGEQGRGDMIQFVRFAALLADRGAAIVLRAPAELHRLLGTAPGITALAGYDEPPPADGQACLMSLPGLLGLDPTAPPAPFRYLAAEAGRVRRWRDRIASLPGVKVGVCWQGNPSVVGDDTRSIPRRHMAGLAAVPGVTLVGLQLGAGPAGDGIRDPGPDFDAGPDAFLDTAAVMENLDLVITSDTAIAHLAGALGRPVWTLLRAVPDWRWLERRTDCPWYPSMRLFRQEAPGDWCGVFARVTGALAGVVAMV
jgi:hypothetical protein